MKDNASLKPAPDQLREYIRQWNDLEYRPLDDGLLRDLKLLKEQIYKLCAANDWQMPPLKKYYFDDPLNPVA